MVSWTINAVVIYPLSRILRSRLLEMVAEFQGLGVLGQRPGAAGGGGGGNSGLLSVLDNIVDESGASVEQIRRATGAGGRAPEPVVVTPPGKQGQALTRDGGHLVVTPVRRFVWHKMRRADSKRGTDDGGASSAADGDGDAVVVGGAGDAIDRIHSKAKAQNKVAFEEGVKKKGKKKEDAIDRIHAKAKAENRDAFEEGVKNKSKKGKKGKKGSDGQSPKAGKGGGPGSLTGGGGGDDGGGGGGGGDKDDSALLRKRCQQQAAELEELRRMLRGGRGGGGSPSASGRAPKFRSAGDTGAFVHGGRKHKKKKKKRSQPPSVGGGGDGGGDGRSAAGRFESRRQKKKELQDDNQQRWRKDPNSPGNLKKRNAEFRAEKAISLA